MASPVGVGYAPPVALAEDGNYRAGEMEYMGGEHIDYRWWRYSKIAFPFLIFMLLWFTTLMCLTLWQGAFTINRIKEGIPRDLEPYRDDHDGDGGLPRPIRNIRFAAVVLIGLGIIWCFLIYYGQLKRKATRGAVGGFAILILIGGILALIAFALDVGKTDRAKKCVTSILPGTVLSKSCESREAMAIAVTVLDMTTFVFAAVVFIMLLLWGKYFHRTRALHFETPDRIDRGGFSPDPMALEEPEADEYDRDIITNRIPYQDQVYSSLIFIGLVALLISAGLLLLFSVLIHEYRERVNGPQWNTSGQTQSGWPRENTRLRLAASIIGAGLCLLSLLPYAHRVYVDILAFGFVCAAVIFFVAFGLDIARIRDAIDLPCPSNVDCVYHPYNATIVFDFIAGLLALAYVALEFVVNKKKSYVRASPFPVAMDEDEYGDFVGLPGYEADYKEAAPLPPTNFGARPQIGVEVIETQNPMTGLSDLQITSVTPGSAAARAGLVPGDHISRWDAMPIVNKASFAQALAAAPLGSVANLEVGRPGAPPRYVGLPIQAF